MEQSSPWDQPWGGPRRGHRGGSWSGGPPPWVEGLINLARSGPGDFGPRGPHRGPKVRRGDVRAAILDVLAVEPMNGYQIIQQIAERNASGREAEARRAEPILAAELDRFERWHASLEVVPTIGALRERGDEIVRRVLAENEGRWESLSDADRERLAAMAKAMVQTRLSLMSKKVRRILIAFKLA